MLNFYVLDGMSNGHKPLLLGMFFGPRTTFPSCNIVPDAYAINVCCPTCSCPSKAMEGTLDVPAPGSAKFDPTANNYLPLHIVSLTTS